MKLVLPINYKKSLSKKSLYTDIDRIKAIIDCELLERKAGNINLQGQEIFYSSTQESNEWNIFKFIDEGNFSVSENNDHVVINYRISIGGLIVKAVMIALIGMIFNRSIWAGPVFLFGVGGINLAIIYFRHLNLLKKIVSKVNVSACTY
ncbi:hypothetical protein LT679_12035 [Mucilaginibacter roseus]|uniref:Uncharacterized protein n=1 Tax=Mucilaginibacter roseus TaxID=1528868 RepID=A0ABS8U5E3_9SPHI|nr:hypothetical protein [Mucilaginibacter roseus]MCD8741335.1 hypothetical protein [Mucilaginibacter roseus]